MANFYQEPNPANDPNYIGSSREPERPQADTSLGGLFAGIGDITGKVGPALESGFKERIKDDAHKLIDPIMDQHGVNLSGEDIKGIAGTGAKGRVRALQMKNGGGLFGEEDSGVSSFTAEDKPDVTAGGIFPDDKARPLPMSAQNEISQLKRMTNGYNAGNLSDSYYYGQLDTVVTKLRNRYQGFRDEIDQAVSQITGVQPANALRASLQRDIQYNQAALLAAGSSDDKFRDKYRSEASALGYDPDKTPMETLRPAVSEYLGRREILKATQLRAEVGSPQAEAALSDSIAATVRTSITKMTNQAQGGKSLTDFTKAAEELTLRGGGSPKEINELVNQMELSKQGLLSQIRAEVYKPIEGRKDGHNLVTLVKDGDQKLGTILQTQIKPWDDMIALVKSGNMSALQASTDALKHQGNIDVQNLYRSFPQARVAASINNAFPNNPIFSNRFIEQTNILPDFGKAIKTGLGNAILGGTDKTPAPTPSEAVKAYGPELEKSGTVYKETAKQYNMVISPENKNVPNAAHVAKQFFGDQTFYDNLNDSGRLKLFMTMASPAKTKFIDTLSASDPEVRGKYEQWAKYAASDIWRRNSDTLQSFLTDKSFDIQYNPQTGLFEDKTKYNRDRGPQPQIVSTAVQSVNNAITLMKPIVGNKPEELLAAMGINPHADKEDGFVKKMFDALGDKLQDWTTSGTREDVKSGRVPVGKTPLKDTPVGAPNQTRGVIKGNLSDSTMLSADPFAIPDGMSPADFIAELKKRHQL